jgi:S-adenosylmethionine/arginine decarboxylase-like enzyme
MGAEQSQFSKLSKKQLVSISVKLIDQDFPIGNPYESDYDDAYSILEEVSRYYSIDATHEDVEFFSKFLEINGEIIAELFANNKKEIKNRLLIEQLVIPVAKSYNLNYSSWGSCTYTNYLTQEFDSYDEEWVKDSATQQLNDGNWNIWDGQETSSTEYDNFEENDYSFDEVYDVDKSKIKNESVLDRLVIENTSEVIGSLDKKTLIKLKSIIESRLRLL